MRRLAAAWLLLVFSLSWMPAGWLGGSYDDQNRSEIDSSPSRRFPLGTDELGRSRLTRLMHATRVTLLVAPAAAAASVILAVAVGLAAGALGGFTNRVFDSGTDLLISLPWLFVLLAVRAALPLDTGPLTMTVASFGFLAFLGWAGPARVIRSAAWKLRREEYVVQAIAMGVPAWRARWKHIIPNLTPIAAAQFWTSLPVFIVAEANLGLLGLGVAEPTPSLGNMLRELQTYGRVSEQPWLLAPAVLLVLITICVQVVARRGEISC